MNFSAEFLGNKSARTYADTKRLVEFIEQTQNYYEIDNHIFVHGWLPNRNKAIFDNWKSASEKDWIEARRTRWIDVYQTTAKPSSKIIVCGHIPTFYAADRFDSSRDKNDSSIFYGNGLIAVDAGTYDSHRVNILVIDD